MVRQGNTAARLLGLILAASGLACTSTQRAGPSAGGEAKPGACFDVRLVRSFSPLHERYVYVRVLSEEHYLLTMNRYCQDLTVATGITITGTFSRVCSDSWAAISYMTSLGPASCRIARVEAVASREAAKKLVEDRTSPKRKN